MAESRDLNVNILGDASSLIAAVEAAGAALKGLVGTQTQVSAAIQAVTLTEAQARRVATQYAIGEAKVATEIRIGAEKVATAEATAEFGKQTANFKAGMQMQVNASKSMLSERRAQITSNLKLEEIEFRTEKQKEVIAEREAAAEKLAAFKAGLKEEQASMSASTGMMTAMAYMMVRRIGSYLKELMSSYTDLAAGTRRLQLVTGGTAEDMSRLQFAANQVGVATEDLSARLILAETHIAKNDQYAQALGVTFKDAAGNMLPVKDQLNQIADALNNVADPNKKIDLARNLFGRGAESILPLLAQGSDGIARLAAEADKLGITMSGRDVQAARAYQIELKQMHAAMQGATMQISKALMPVIAAAANGIEHLASWFSKMWTSGTQASHIFKLVALTLGAVVVALTAAAVAGKIWAGIETLMTAAATPYILAIMAIIAALVLLVKSFEPAGKVVEIFFGGLGLIAGSVAAAVVLSFQIMMSAVSLFVDGLAHAASWIGKTFHIGWLKSAGDGVSHFVEGANKKMADFIMAAPKTGLEVGLKFGTALVNAIKELKMPSLGSLLKGAGPGATDTQLLGPDLSTLPGGAVGGGGGAAKNKVQAFFKTLVDTAREQLEAAKKAAEDAKKQMDDMAQSVGDKLRESLSLTSVSDAAFAAYTGPQALLRKFQQRLDAMRGFVGNLRRLRDLGLPPTMLADIASQGAEKGAALAKMLVANPSIFPQLADIQNAIDVETSAAGLMVGQAVYGGQVAGLIGQAQASQMTFNRYLGAARQGGYQPTQQDIDASTQNIYNTVMGLQTQADPAQIEAAIAWALRTGALRGGVGGGGGGGGGRPVMTGTPYDFLALGFGGAGTQGDGSGSSYRPYSDAYTRPSGPMPPGAQGPAYPTIPAYRGDPGNGGHNTNYDWDSATQQYVPHSDGP